MNPPAKQHRLRLLVALSWAAIALTLRAQDTSAPDGVGRTLFTQHCASCHALAQDGIGPPLGGVTSLRTKRDLVARIRDPATLIAAGDARASALVRRYKAVMPPFAHLTDAEIAAILAFIEEQSAAQGLQPFAIASDATPTSPARLARPVEKSELAIELDDFVQIPRLPGRTAYKGITLLRADPREDGALLVDELMGLLYRVTKDRGVDVFLDVRPFFPEFLCDPGVASGLGSFALHPDFGRNGVFYTSHSERFRGTPAINANPPALPPSELPPLEWVLTEWRLADPAATIFVGTHREVLRLVTPTTAHNAQEIAFAPVTDSRDADYGKLYIGVGDGGAANLKRPDIAGHPRTLLGAILRIDPTGRDGANGQYGIPPDNPFAQSGDPTVRREIWAYGFRNPHRMSWDLVRGSKRMIAVDIGEANIEEINLIEPGGAYGWGVAAIEGSAHIDVLTDAKVVRPATATELTGVRLPVAAYDHADGAAITGGFVYRGPLEALREKYVFGDIVNGRLFFIHLDAASDDATIRELAIVRDGAPTSIKHLAGADRAHLRLGYDERSGDMFVLTKDDGMIRRISAAYQP
jgi:mono/diheme cytochrome c family protein